MKVKNAGLGVPWIATEVVGQQQSVREACRERSGPQIRKGTGQAAGSEQGRAWRWKTGNGPRQGLVGPVLTDIEAWRWIQTAVGLGLVADLDSLDARWLDEVHDDASREGSSG